MFLKPPECSQSWGSYCPYVSFPFLLSVVSPCHLSLLSSTATPGFCTKHSTKTVIIPPMTKDPLIAGSSEHLSAPVVFSFAAESESVDHHSSNRFLHLPLCRALEIQRSVYWDSLLGTPPPPPPHLPAAFSPRFPPVFSIFSTFQTLTVDPSLPCSEMLVFFRFYCLRLILVY